MAKKQFSYSRHMNELQQILDELQSGDISIDDLQKKVSRAKELIVLCKEKLRDTKEDINSILGEV